MDIENLLYDEIATDFEKLRNETLEPEKRKALVDETLKFMDRAIEMKRLENEHNEKTEARVSEENEKAETRLSNQAIELQKLKEDRTDRIVKNVIGAAGIILPLAVTIWGTKVSMAFEKEDSFTTTMGRGFVNKLFFRK